jgi:Mn-dependent DtxR family transcriptional regulator
VAEAKSNLHWRGQIATLHRAHDNLAASLAKIHQESASNGEAVPQISEPPASPVVLNPPLRSKSVIRREDVQRATQSTQATYDGEPLHKKYQKLLDSLASLEAMGVLAPERAVVAAVAGVSPKSSAFDGNVRCLKAEELLSYPNAGVLAITDAGRERARATDRLLTTDDLHEAWRRCPALKPAHVKLLDVLIARYPREIGRQDLADAAEVSVASSAFDGNIRLLKKIGLVEYPSHGLVLADKKLLFPEEL